MAKRVAADNREYRPVEEALVRSVMEPQGDENVTIPSSNGGETHAESADTGPSVKKTVLQSGPSNGQDVDPIQTVEKLTREKRVLLSPGEEREIEALVARMAETLGTPVKLSHMLRAYMTLLLHAESELLQRARQIGPLRRPPNGDAIALARFEHSLSQILSSAFRQAPPIR